MFIKKKKIPELKDIGEFGLLEKIKTIVGNTYNLNVSLSIGDDAFGFRSNENLLVSTDELVEDVHFIKRIFSAYSIGFKAIASNASDIAACGGVPRFFLISLSLPPRTKLDWIISLYKGMLKACERFGGYIVGGNITQSKNISITTTVIGEAEKVISRSGAKNNEYVFCTGTLGDSSLGLEILLKIKNLKKLNQIEAFLSKRHLEPLPRVEIGKKIRNIATSCIDISDGLLQDLEHVSKASEVGFKIFLENIPLSYEYQTYTKNLDLNKKYSYALTGGEDYELVFTSPKEYENEIYRISEETGVKISKIGITNETGKITVCHSGTEINFPNHGWKHF